jgi:thiol-disulfide isomerase/thioredoxin
MMGRLVGRLAAGLAIVAFSVQASTAGEASVPIGQNVGKLAFKDIRYLSRSLADITGKKAFVIVCTNTTCPLVQKYLPKIKRLEEKYRGQGVQFVSLNVNPDDSIREMAAHAVEFDVPFPTVKDTDGQSTAALGVSRTPETVVLTPDFVLRYRGRIDDQYRLGGAAPSAVHNDLENAIQAVLANKAVPVTETTVDGCRITHAARPRPAGFLTYNKDVAPLLRKHCVECHQPGTEAPFSLLTYEETKKQGQPIAEVVADEAMPPWYASAAHDDFVNRRVLKPEERETIVAWVRAGMPRGTGAVDSSPIPLRKVEGAGWLIGKPDLIVRTKTHSVPADGYVKYRYDMPGLGILPLPYLFMNDTWIDRIQILPDNPKAVHHCNLIMIPAPPKSDPSKALFVTGKVPGGIPMELKDGIALKVPKGYVPLLQIHFTTNGHAEKCSIAVGFRYAREKVQKELHLERISSHDFAIAPGDPYYKIARTWQTKHDIFAEGLFTHMHLRGKDMTYLAHLPSGKTETLLLVPNYSFDWQIGYQWPSGVRRFPKGTRFEVVAHYDNSPFNPYNPDPTKTVKEGDQTYDEMMYGFLFYTVADEHLNLDINPKNGTAIKHTKVSSR